MSDFLATYIYPVGWVIVLMLTLVGVWRVTRGPSTLDRMVGIDAVTVGVVAMTVLFSMQDHSVQFIELVIVVTALGFLTTVAFYYYLAQPGTGAMADDVNEEKEGSE
jgi:multicomponent Na+:H+ antiporter subunit F